MRDRQNFSQLERRREADEHKRREGHSIFVNEKAGAVRRKIHITLEEEKLSIYQKVGLRQEPEFFFKPASEMVCR